MEKQQEKEPPTFNQLFEKAKDYVDTRIDLVKLKATQTTSDVVPSLVSKVVLLFFLIIFFLMVNIGIALLLGEVLGKTYYGFFIVGVFYALVGLLLHLFRKQWIKQPISNRIIQKMTGL